MKHSRKTKSDFFFPIAKPSGGGGQVGSGAGGARATALGDEHGCTLSSARSPGGQAAALGQGLDDHLAEPTSSSADSWGTIRTTFSFSVTRFQSSRCLGGSSSPRGGSPGGSAGGAVTLPHRPVTWRTCSCCPASKVSAHSWQKWAGPPGGGWQASQQGPSGEALLAAFALRASPRRVAVLVPAVWRVGAPQSWRWKGFLLPAAETSLAFVDSMELTLTTPAD